MLTDTSRPDRVVREAERRQITGIPTSSWYDLQNAGLAPKPFSLTGSRSVGWSFNELTDFVEARKATRADKWQSLGHAAARTIKKIESRR
jgi:predicted DNA-binding transcriptional regulator AlpA